MVHRSASRARFHREIVRKIQDRNDRRLRLRPIDSASGKLHLAALSNDERTTAIARDHRASLDIHAEFSLTIDRLHAMTSNNLALNA